MEAIFPAGHSFMLYELFEILVYLTALWTSAILNKLI